MTEAVQETYRDIALWPTHDAVAAMIRNQMAAAEAVMRVRDDIARAADAAADILQDRGRLIYTGAGTSGRDAVQDGVELGPTYGWPDARLAFVIAGGSKALTHSVEGAEDDQAAGQRDGQALAINRHDVIIGLAASGSTPYTIAVLETARAAGALTIGFACKGPAPLLLVADIGILMETGAEAIAGSTRMKAGTAQKIALNALSTAIMMRLGLVYEGRMVAMRISNRKLEKRARIMVAELAGVDDRAAAAALDLAERDIRTAILIARGWTLAGARSALTQSRGHLGAILQHADKVA